MTKSPSIAIAALLAALALGAYLKPGANAGATPVAVVPGVAIEDGPVSSSGTQPGSAGDSSEPGYAPGSPGDPGDSPFNVPPVVEEPLPVLTEPNALLLDYMTCLGLPLGEDLPPKTRTFGDWRFSPNGIYQIACVVTDEAAVPRTNLNWNFTIRGGKLSDILLESYPPQLGNGVDAIELKSGIVAFQLNPGAREPAAITIKATDGTSTWEKTVLLVSTDVDLTTLEYVPGELLMGITPGAKPSSEFVAFMEGEHIDVIEPMGDYALHLKDRTMPARDPWVLQDVLLWRPEVRYTEPNYIRHAMQ